MGTWRMGQVQTRQTDRGQLSIWASRHFRISASIKAFFLNPTNFSRRRRSSMACGYLQGNLWHTVGTWRGRVKEFLERHLWVRLCREL